MARGEQLESRVRRLRAHAAARELALVALAALAYFGVRNMTVGSAVIAVDNAERLLRLERGLGIAWEATLQSWLLAHGALVTAANWVYIWGHWPVILTVGVVLYRSRHDRYVLLRNAMLVSGALGFVFFAFFPVAPPRLMDLPLVDTVTRDSNSYRALQPPGLTNQYAAFPSLHFGWNVLVGVAVWGASTQLAVRTFAVLGPLAMGAAVVLTANHYLVDVAGGLAVVLVGLAAARAIERREAGLHSLHVLRRRTPGRQRARPTA